ncbi:alpha/beta hydrolase fold protein [Anabaenopsis circularis NIES-21]|uniref:Alpha/beta hydrolase fold protein n=1 Tax=Anabaenopsis circularis NIES-21 TaxID=1085406 RepID=A0A1Z4GK60_9CYAN|nr:alpha/beta hydrolase fold protein [Anabaenopsis circularis NIES-21]
MPKVHVNEIDIFYEVKGSGEPLLLIAGFMCDRSYWSLLLPHLVSHYQVIRFDNRGIGQSSIPNSPYSTQQMATDTSALLDILGIKQAHIIGHSMGGQIAQELALLYPEKIKSLVLLASLAKGNERFNQLVESWGDVATKIDLKLYEKLILPWIFTDNFYAIPQMVDQLVEWVINYPSAPTANGIYHQSRAIIHHDTTDRMKNIHCPTLVMVGKQDILTPVTFSQKLAQNIPLAELQVIEDGGHGFLIESTEVVTQAILNFLAKF